MSRDFLLALDGDNILNGLEGGRVNINEDLALSRGILVCGEAVAPPGEATGRWRTDLGGLSRPSTTEGLEFLEDALSRKKKITI